MRAGIDVGGTFTDLAAVIDGTLRVVKVPTTSDQSEGFMAALHRAGDATEVLHGTTVATNAVLERRGARLGFVATQGFRHLLQLARQDRPRLYDLAARRPEALAADELCVGVPERMAYDGTVLQPLDEAATREALAALAGRVDTVAITLLHAYANPAHERRVAEIAREELGCEVSASCELLPEFREYERASTTALNAYVQPAVSRYLDSLATHLGSTPLAVMRSGGGLRGVQDASRHPVHLLLSGPAAGVIGAAWFARRVGIPDVITLDMGGTSADVAVIDDATPAVAEESALDGLPFRTPCIDVISVGAGGGSIAWLDDGGALRVGPRSAGATPGPACYGRGGTQPAVTDAHVVAGHLGDDGLAGGELALHPDLARKAVGDIAARVGMSLDDAAAGILRVVRATMTRAVRSVSVERGNDPRRYALVAFGGAGPLHGVALARELGMSRMVVPPSPGALAAFGLLVSRRRADVSRSHPCPATPANDGVIGALLDELAAAAAGELSAEGVAAHDIQRFVDCRYEGQSYELRIPVSGGFETVVAAFHDAHLQRYGFARRDGGVEAVTFRATALGPEPDVQLRAPAARTVPSPVASHTIEGHDVAVWRRADLPSGFEVVGPALITELDSTTLLEPGSRGEVDEHGALVIET